MSICNTPPPLSLYDGPKMNPPPPPPPLPPPPKESQIKTLKLLKRNNITL